jgi:hypothetical protein
MEINVQKISREYKMLILRGATNLFTYFASCTGLKYDSNL